MKLADWRLLAGAACAQLAARCAVGVMRLPRLRAQAALVRPVARLLLPGADDRVIWAVEATGRRMKGVSTCLVRALVLEARFASRARCLSLEVGVRRGADGALQSHAWLRDRERVLTGGPVDGDFVPMLSWESAA